jgi:hypothetical protein
VAWNYAQGHCYGGDCGEVVGEMLENRSTHLTLHAREAAQAATVCARGSYGPLYRLSRNEHRGYTNPCMDSAPGLSQPGAVDVRIEESSISSPRGHMVEGKNRHRGRLPC